MRLTCDTHSHTVASTHAYSTVHDYIRDAKANGLELFTLTDHAPTMPDAPHFWHFGNMKILPRVVDGVVILRGIEANILPSTFNDTQRYVDLPDGLLPFLDLAIASFHEPVFTPGSRIYNTRAVLRALESDCIQILGHLGNPNFPIEVDEVVQAAIEHNVAIEVNNSSFTHSRKGSYDNCRVIVESVSKHGGKLVVSSDAHFSAHVGLFNEAISLLNEIGVEENQIVSRNPTALLSFLAEHGKPVADELAELAGSA